MAVLEQGGTSRSYNSRGMQESQGILVVHVSPLLQESIDVRQASPLPAGCTGEHQGERAHLSVAVIALLPQLLLVGISEPMARAAEWAGAHRTAIFKGTAVHTTIQWLPNVTTHYHRRGLVTSGNTPMPVESECLHKLNMWLFF